MDVSFEDTSLAVCFKYKSSSLFIGIFKSIVIPIPKTPDISPTINVSALNIDDSHYPAMKDKYVKVVGNLGQYTGNTQIGFVTRMLKMNKSEITEPTMNYQTIDETFLTSTVVRRGA